MKKILSIILIVLLVLLLDFNVNADDVYVIRNIDDIDNIVNVENIRKIEIIDLTIDDLSFLNNYRDIESIIVKGCTININSLDEELINKIEYRNTYIKGEFNSLYKFKDIDQIVNTEYNYNPKYDDDFNRMAKYIYVDGMTDEQIVKNVTLFVLDYMSYEKDLNNHDDGKCYSHYGICSNYTELESVLLNKLGIYAITINGYTDKKDELNSYHSWNLVYLNDSWFIIDPVYLDLYDSSDAIEKDLSVEYYMKEITRDFTSNHMAYYNYLDIPTDFLQSRMSIIDKLNEIGEYVPSQPEVLVEEVVDDDYINEQIFINAILLLISIVIIIITIKDKKKLREKIVR